MRIATGCIDSITSRLKYFCRWPGRCQPDLVARRKTFERSNRLPGEALQHTGHESAFHTRDGELNNGWGIAVFSRKTIPTSRILLEGLPGQEDSGARFPTVGVRDLEFWPVYALYRAAKTVGVDRAIRREIAL